MSKPYSQPGEKGTDNTQAELRNLLGELQNRTVSAFTSRRYDEQNILRDEYQEAITNWHNKQIEAVLDRAK